MPKRLPNIKSNLLEAANAILQREGYAALSIRRLATECGVANGTVYNYYRNKDELIAYIMMEDWRVALKRLDEETNCANTLADGLVGMYRHIAAFVMQYQDIWTQYSQSGGSGGVISSHHMQLRSQITERVNTLIRRLADLDMLMLAPLLAELLLVTAVQPDLDETLLRLMATRLIK